MKILKSILLIILLLGGLNWIVVGMINVDIITGLLGHSKIVFAIYIVVGLSAIYASISLLNSLYRK